MRPAEEAEVDVLVAGTFAAPTKFLHYAELQAPLTERVVILEPPKAWDAFVAEASERAGWAGRLADLELAGEAASVPLTVDHWRMLIRELVDNALRFSDAGSRVSAMLASTPDGTELTVRDQGRGMSHEHLAALENRAPYLRRHQDHAGPGLGLSIVQRLLELHRGELTFESAPGKGTLVRVLFRRK